jgi:hypothetical protein
MRRIDVRLIGVSLLCGAIRIRRRIHPHAQPADRARRLFQCRAEAVLTINSGDTVTIESVAGLDPEIIDASGVIPPSAVPEYVRAIRREVTERGPRSAHSDRSHFHQRRHAG